MKIINSFKYACQGLWFCIKNERNFRIHIVAAITVILFSRLYKVTESEIPLLVFSVIFVFVTEMINTAIEVVVDFISPHYSEMAKISKDIAAGAVLIAALSAVIIAFNVFGDVEKLINAVNIILSSPNKCVFTIAFIIVSLIFVFMAGKERKIK